MIVKENVLLCCLKDFESLKSYELLKGQDFFRLGINFMILVLII